MAGKPSQLRGFGQPFPTRDAAELTRALGRLDGIALGELEQRLPDAMESGDPQRVENALRDTAEAIATKVPPSTIRATAFAIARGVNRKHAQHFFAAVARATKLNVVNTDEPQRAEATLSTGLFSATVTPGGPGGKLAIVTANLNPALFVEQFAEQTTSKITTLAAGIVDGTRDALVREVVLGQGDPKELTRRLLKQWEKNGVPSKIPTRRRNKAGLPVMVDVRSHAAFIAHDQIGSLQSELTRARQTAAGVSSFVWVTRRDGKVRDEHIERDAKTYSWADGADGEFPGGPPNCRCHAMAVVEPDAVAETLVRP